jgi:hypothetical protein
MPTNTEREVEAANARLAVLFVGTPIHGAFRQFGTSGAFPLVSVGVHCTQCEKSAGGTTDFSGEVGPEDGVGAADSIVRLLAAKGCVHAAALLPPPSESPR